MFNCTNSNKKTILRLFFVRISQDLISCHLCLKVSLEVKVESNEKNLVVKLSRGSYKYDAGG